VRKECPLDVFPLYVRAGSIVPVGPFVQYASDQPAAPYEIRVYPGADGRFTLYEDDGETYAYERGERATYELVWDDATATLSVGARQGSFPGLVASRELRVVLMDPAQGAAGASGPGAARSVRYSGQAVSVSLSR